jgi:Flp pilus assembly protein TadD
MRYAIGRLLPGIAVCLLAGFQALVLTGCASKQLDPSSPPPFRHSGRAVKVADVDVLAVSPEMEEFLERYVLPYQSLSMRRYLLDLAVTQAGELDFEYDASQTLTAQESFASRSGNCIAFANMLIALARRSGLQANYQEVTLQPEWFSEKDTILVANHINVVLRSEWRTFVRDVSGLDFKTTSYQKTLSDTEAKALYYGNLGAEALLENDLPTAYAYTVKAIETAPSRGDAWSNLGVILLRNGQPREAEQAYKRAMDVDSEAYSAMNNLYALYEREGNFTEGQRMKVKVERYRLKNPYYLLMLSNEALAQERFDESAKLLKRAIKKRDNDHRLHFALAKTQYLSGATDDAQNSLTRARELAPEDMLADYDRPLDELVLQH